MARMKLVNGVMTPLAPEEEAARDAEEAVWEAAAPERALVEVRAKRAHEYPTVGDVIDAILKKEADSDSSELASIMTARDAIKKKYPKE